MHMRATISKLRMLKKIGGHVGKKGSRGNGWGYEGVLCVNKYEQNTVYTYTHARNWQRIS